MKTFFTQICRLLVFLLFPAILFAQQRNDYSILLNSGTLTPVENVNTLSKSSSLFQNSLFGNKHYVTIQEEIDLLKLYIALEAQRLKDTINFEIEVAQGIDADDALIPTMLLQPIIENSIWHGLTAETNPKKIKLNFTREGAFMYITIENNGKSLPLPSPRKHISHGLQITQERILLLYEKPPNFPCFSLENGKENGVVVKMVLPFRAEFE